MKTPQKALPWILTLVLMGLFVGVNVNAADNCRKERSYTVKEIDELRSVVEQRWLFGTSVVPDTRSQMSRSYQEDEKTRCVEELVRTYMLAGKTADDLRKEDTERAKSWNKIRDEKKPIKKRENP